MKHGISPLIATILLIGFTVAITISVIIWASSFTEKRIEETEQKIALLSCSDIIFELVNVEFNSPIITATVDSRGKTFSGFAVQGICVKGSFIGRVDQIFNPLDKITFNIETKGECQEVKEIKFVPFIGIKDSIQLCNGKEQTGLVK